MFLRSWFPERSTMQAFGRRPDLQLAKVAEVTSVSEQLGELLAGMLKPSPDDRLSATELAELISG